MANAIKQIKDEADKYDMTLTMDLDALASLPDADEAVKTKCAGELKDICTAAFADTDISPENEVIRDAFCGKQEADTQQQ